MIQRKSVWSVPIGRASKSCVVLPVSVTIVTLTHTHTHQWRWISNQSMNFSLKHYFNFKLCFFLNFLYDTQFYNIKHSAGHRQSPIPLRPPPKKIPDRKKHFLHLRDSFSDNKNDIRLNFLDPKLGNNTKFLPENIFLCWLSLLSQKIVFRCP